MGGVGGQVPGEGLEQEGVADVVRVGGAGLGVVLGHGSDAASPPPRPGTFHATGCVSFRPGAFDAVGRLDGEAIDGSRHVHTEPHPGP